jgi:hypothetical protein
MPEYGAFRFGRSAPSRIAGTTVMLAGSDEQLPAEPTYQLIVPFAPPAISGGGASSSSSTTADGHKLWKQVPDRCDLLFYQGDDVVIPLFFAEPVDLDMDNQDMWLWVAQIRTRHTFRSTLVNEFITHATYMGAVPPETQGTTMVELFLPRDDNCYSGVYRWDLCAYAPVDLMRFPKPDDVDEADWPPIDALKTWLYGVATIVPRVTSTDFLPPPETPPGVTVLTQQGWFVGPNGRVP